MEILSIFSARAMAWIEPIELTPRDGVYYPDLVKALVARYGFQKFPTKLEEFDEGKGVTFASGRAGSIVIEQLIVYTYGIVLDTRTNTKDSRRLLEEAFEWGASELGLTYKPGQLKRWQYASSLIFRTDVPLTTMHPAFQKAADTLHKAMGSIMGENLDYQLTNFTIDYDQLTRKHPLGRFSIQRRDNTPFSDNKYYSDAPLPTDMHIELLQEFEADISGNVVHG